MKTDQRLQIGLWRTLGPGAIITLFAALSLSAQTGSGAEGKEGDLPEAKEILARFVEAVGGREAFLKVESQHAKGESELGGMSGRLEVFSAKPNYLLLTMTMPAIGEIATGFNGEVAWVNNALTGPMVLEGAQRDQIKEQADFYAILKDDENYESMKTAGRKEFEGKETYQVDLVKKSGQKVTEYYDVKSGLLVGFTGEQETELGLMNVTNVLAEYKKFGDLLVPTHMTQRLGPVQLVLKITSVEFNTVPEEKFELPPAIKVLVDQP